MELHTKSILPVMKLDAELGDRLRQPTLETFFCQAQHFISPSDLFGIQKLYECERRFLAKPVAQCDWYRGNHDRTFLA